LALWYESKTAQCADRTDIVAQDEEKKNTIQNGEKRETIVLILSVLRG